MPIHVEISHFDRLVVGVARGSVTVQEYGSFIADRDRGGIALAFKA